MWASRANSNATQRHTGLSGHVHIRVDDPGTATALDRALDEIRQAGWRVTIVDAEGGDTDQPGWAPEPDLVARRNRDRVTISAGSASSRPATEPAQLPGEAAGTWRGDARINGFSMLSALGGGRIERVLAESVTADIPVDRLIVGFNWTLVRAGDLCGIARSPARGTEGARTVRVERGFRGRPLSELAGMLLSLDPLSRSVGLAAVNAFWNRADAPNRDDGNPGALGFARFAPPGDGLVVVGGFPEVRQLLPDAQIVEREPMAGDIAASDADDALGAARQIAITAQALMNGSLERLLALSAGATTRMLIGPSAPLCPLLLRCDLTDISGVTVVDPHRAEDFICETGTQILNGGMVRLSALTS